MFKVKRNSNRVPGQCIAARCGGPAPADGRPFDLCDRHLAEWQAAGQPALDEAKPRASKAAPADVLPPDQIEAQIAPIRAGAEHALAAIAQVDMSSQAAVDWMGAAHIEIKKQLGELEKLRTSITKPLNEAKRAVDALFKPARETLEACSNACNTKLLQFARAQEAAKSAALAQIGAGSRDPDVLSVVHGGSPELPPTIVEAYTWRWEVTDFSLIPREFLQVDEKALNFYVRHRKAEAVGAIPGVRVYEDMSLRAAPGSLS